MWANQADGGSLRFAIPSLQDPDRPTCRGQTLELATSCPPARGPGELSLKISDLVFTSLFQVLGLSQPQLRQLETKCKGCCNTKCSRQDLKSLKIIQKLCQFRCEDAKCSDCPDRDCKDCPEKPGAAKKVVEKMRAWWALTPLLSCSCSCSCSYSLEPENDKQQPVGKKEEEEDKKDEKP